MAISARNYALSLLRYRGRSERELRERLKKKGFTESETQETVESLKESGYIDDRALAEHLRHQAIINKRLGFDGARIFMLKRGLSKEIVNSSLGYSEEAELQNIEILIKKKMRSIRDYPEPKRTRSLAGFLARRGFHVTAIRKALNRLNMDKEIE